MGGVGEEEEEEAQLVVHGAVGEGEEELCIYMPAQYGRNARLVSRECHNYDGMFAHLYISCCITFVL